MEIAYCVGGKKLLYLKKMYPGAAAFVPLGQNKARRTIRRGRKCK